VSASAPARTATTWPSDDLRRRHSARWSEAAGSDVLPFSSAEMDLGCDPVILQAVRDRLELPMTYEPPYTDGVVGATLAAYYRECHGMDLTGANFWLTTGTISSSYAVNAVLLQPGDEAVYFAPSYHCVPESIESAGAVARPVHLDVHRDEPWGAADLRAAITSRTRLISLCNPHNPTGHVFGESELATIVEVARRHDLVILSNELHSRLVLEGRHTPVQLLAPERTITLDSATKSHNMAGIGGAFVCAQDAEWLHELRRAAGHRTAPIRGIQQVAMAAAFATPDTAWLRSTRDRLRRSRDALADALASARGDLLVHRPAATFFLWIRDPASLDAQGDFERHTGIRGLPGSSFRASVDYFRLAHAVDSATLATAVARIADTGRVAD
jgi:cysteine-S-conjugate beta-lyase